MAWLISLALAFSLAPLPVTPSVITVPQAQVWARVTLGPTQYHCLDRIVFNESRWDPTVWNRKGSGAYGLGQARPPEKMAAYGDDYMYDPLTQLHFVIGYATQRYGSLCAAWAFWLSQGWW